MRQIVLLVLFVNLAEVCFGWTQPFSATKNLTIQSYNPNESFLPARVLAFNAYVSLTNASIFNLGPALVRTYSYPMFKNYTVPMPEVVYNGPVIKKENYILEKTIDPCTLLITTSSAIDFPEAWTNAQAGTFRLEAIDARLDTITLERPWRWDPTVSDCNEDGTQCTSYLMWQGPVNHTTLYLSVYASDYTISDVIRSITFRQIGSRSCPQNGQTTTTDDYSFSIDFATTYVARRMVLLQDLPQNTSFIVSITTNKKYSSIFPSLTLRTPSTVLANNVQHLPFSFGPYLTYILSGALSLLLLLASSIAIVVLKCRQRRALRAEYENIPGGDEAINDH